NFPSHSVGLLGESRGWIGVRPSLWQLFRHAAMPQGRTTPSVRWRRQEQRGVRLSGALPRVLQKMQKNAIELLVILQKSEMTYAGQEQQSGIWDYSGHEFGILALDRLVVIAVNDPDRYCNCGKLLGGEIWLCRPHSGYLVEERFVRLWRWRDLLVFRLRP